MMTRYQTTVTDRSKRRYLTPTNIRLIGAARMEYTARRRIERTRHFTEEDFLLPYLRIRPGNRFDEPLRIRMQRPVVYVIAKAEFNEPA
jgi:hypothetical protein